MVAVAFGTYVDRRAMIVEHQIEFAERRIVVGVLQVCVVAQALVQRAHVHEEGQQVPVGVATAAGAAVRLDPLATAVNTMCTRCPRMGTIRVGSTTTMPSGAASLTRTERCAISRAPALVISSSVVSSRVMGT